MDAFEDLEVWKKSSALAVGIYHALRNCRDRSLKDQITRAAVSVPSNIAEGFERNSSRQFIQYLRIAKGSCGEFRSQLYLLRKIGLINRDSFEQLRQEAIEVSKMLQGLIKHCSNN